MKMGVIERTKEPQRLTAPITHSHTHTTQTQTQAAAVWMGHDATKGLWKVYNPLVQDLLAKSVHLDRWHPLQADPQCRRRCDKYAAAQSVRLAPGSNGGWFCWLVWFL